MCVGGCVCGRRGGGGGERGGDDVECEGDEAGGALQRAAPTRPPPMQGPSPDEVALVEAARQMGFEFKNRAQSTVTLSMLGREVTYEVLNIMEYSRCVIFFSFLFFEPGGGGRSTSCEPTAANALPERAGLGSG